MEELDVAPTEDELSKTIDSLASGKAPAMTASPLTYSRAARPLFFTLCMNFSASTGKKAPYHKTCETPKLSPCIRTKVKEMTAKTTEESRY